MELLRKYFPFSFREKKDVKELLIHLAIMIVAGFIVGLVLGLVGLIPVLGPIVAWLVGSLCELYVLASVVLCVLDYLKVLK